MWWTVLAVAHAEPRCLTPQMLRASRDPAGMRFVPRPAEVGYVDSATYPIRVHYRRTQDAARAQNVVLPAAETSWAVEVDQMGWPRPPEDGAAGGDARYDLYLTNEGTYGGAYTWGLSPDTDPNDNYNSRTTYIALDDRWISDADMLVFVSHEFNHALQYTIDASEMPLVMWEGTAETIADMVDEPRNGYLYEIPYFQLMPFESLLFDSYVPQIENIVPFSYYEYGAIVFGMFIEERYGTNDGTTLLRMWELAAQNGPAPEPDWLDALDQLDPSVPSHEALYTEFSVWRMFGGDQDDGAHYEEASLWRGAIPPVEADLLLGDVDGLQVAPRPEFQPFELGASYWRIDLTGGTTDELHLEVNGDPATQWGLAWAVWPVGGGPAWTGFTVPVPGAPATAVVPLAGGQMAMFGVVNAGRVGLEAEVPTSQVGRHDFTVDMTLEAPPPPAHTGDTGTTTPEHTGTPTDTDPPDPTDGSTTDTGPGPDDTDPPQTEEDPSGCGCDTPGPGGVWGLLLAGAALASTRRRRTR
ncbi:MAG: hypothetical protein H6738_02165 [Alphaproteobacteria bacterium]|nr:hypothetical protein [Alphaproteobacteria bacterium]MCB9695574.1 hypothetical protein [Alphaproteobacteria bacterium]